MSRKSKLFVEGLLLLGAAVLLAAVYEPSRSSAKLLGLSTGGNSTASIGVQSPQLEIYKPEQVAPGFVVLPEEGNAEVKLLGPRGELLHTWAVDATRARLLPNGHLLVVHGTKWGGQRKTWRKLRNRLVEYDWSGRPVWNYRGADVLHHDVRRLPNGNTLLLRRFMVPDELKQTIEDPARRSQPIRSDAVLEVTPKGDTVWEWRAHDHFDLEYCGQKGCRERSGGQDVLSKMRDWTHINTASVIPENKWFDGGNEIFRPGNVIVLPRNFWTTYIVDRESGKIVWEYNGDYRGGVSGGHEAHMIPKGLPGAGNILLFDNGRKKHPGESFILEIDPTTKKVVWVYDAGKEFYSIARGSAQRLPNGNTLISQDYSGRCFEVSVGGEIVWSYQSPLEINRCHKYPLDYTPQFRQFADQL